MTANVFTSLALLACILIADEILALPLINKIDSNRLNCATNEWKSEWLQFLSFVFTGFDGNPFDLAVAFENIVLFTI